VKPPSPLKRSWVTASGAAPVLRMLSGLVELVPFSTVPKSTRPGCTTSFEMIVPGVAWKVKVSMPSMVMFVPMVIVARGRAPSATRLAS
jgi:hypothetical protein